MKYLKIILIVVIIIIGIFAYINYNKIKSQEYFFVNDNEILLLLADTPSSRVKGLSGMKSLADNIAMLFVFDKEDKYGIWMKDMKFALDIIWLDREKKVVYIESNVSPNTFPKVFYPTSNSLYVIEGNSGFALRNSITVGKIFDIDAKKSE